MNNDKLRLELNNLERKLKILINEHSRLVDEKNALQVENKNLKARLHENEESLTSFQNRVKISKIAEGMVAGGVDSTELKRVIDDYIKEIDKCIAHLGEA